MLKNKVKKIIRNGFSHRLKLLLIVTCLRSVCAEFVSTVDEHDEYVRLSRASHFLSQASMGGTVEGINALSDRIAAIGYIPACEEWIDNQLLLPRGEDFNSIALRMSAVETGGNSSFYEIWWDQAMKSDEQLRLRMGWALSQILVVSDNYWQGLDVRGGRWRGHVNYYNMLLDSAFTSHREILEDVTYHSMMGVWLSHSGNAKGNPLTNSVPDQNYAREIMQLFSVGIYAQDASGKYILNYDNVPVENYDQDDILQFSNVFTGLAINDQREFLAKSNSLISPTKPMIAYEDYHDQTEKELLGGTVLPAGQSTNKDVLAALDNLSSHSSTAPYFSRLLIKRFTSSNPSNQYIKRVTDAWYGEGPYGTEVEGDFTAVLKAILLDTEARDAIVYSHEGGITRIAAADPLRGKIKSPILRMAQFYRFADIYTPAEGVQEDGVMRITRLAQTSAQYPLNADTVFNYYTENYAPTDGAIGTFVQQYGIDNPYEPVYEVTAPEAQYIGQFLISDFEVFHRVVTQEEGYTDTFLGYNENYAFERNDIYPALAHIEEIQQGLFSSDQELLRYLDVMLCHGCLPYGLVQDLLTDIDTEAGTNNQALGLVLGAIFQSPAYSVGL